MTDVEITGYVPGAIGKITELHATYYSKNHGLGLFFEARVATEMSEFLSRYDSTRDGFWIAIRNGEVVGSIAIDGIKHETEGAHLRWFIVAPKHQGQGVGNKLLEKAIEFCKEKRYKRAYLWTITGLDAARHLYEKSGFRLALEHEGKQWGVIATEQLLELVP